MKIFKSSNLVRGRSDDAKYQSDLDSDIKKIVFAISGRIRFGDGADGTSGENISGQFQQFTSHASANTEFAVSHDLGVIPVGAIVIWQDKAGDLYQGPSTGTSWTSTNVYFKCSVSSVTFKVFLLK